MWEVKDTNNLRMARLLVRALTRQASLWKQGHSAGINCVRLSGDGMREGFFPASTVPLRKNHLR